MKHMCHEDFVNRICSMMQKMDKIGYPKDALIILAQKVNKLWIAVQEGEIKELGNNFYPFLPIIPTSVFPIEEQCLLLGISIPEDPPFRGDDTSESQEPYFITNVNDGSEFFESNISSARLSIEDKKRKSLSDVEALSLFFHSDALVDPFKNKMSCFASLGTKYFSYPSEEEYIPMFDLQLGKLFLIRDETKTNILCPSKGTIEV